MKQLLYFFLAFIFFLNIFACTKTPLRYEEFKNVAKDLSILVSTDSPTLYNYVWICNQQLASSLDSNYLISATAGFTDSVTLNQVPIIGLSINARTLTANNLTYTFDYSDTAAYLQEGLNLYGTNVKVKITGSSASDTVTTLIYMPKKLLIKSSDVPSGNQVILNNLTLKWTPDPLCTWGNVGIKVDYNGTMNQAINGTSFSGKDTSLNYTAEDNGNFTISTNDLQKFKVGSIITVTFGRGSNVSAVLPISKKTIFYYATSSVQSSYITLITSNSSFPLNGSNQFTIPFKMTATNVTTLAVYTFNLNPNTGTTYLGQIPPGKYNIVITHSGASLFADYQFNSLTANGNNATFSNVAISGSCNLAIINPVQ
jgi:hypothetical protein